MDKITKEQSRGARGLLNWSQDDLAKNANVAKATVYKFEAGRSEPQPIVHAAFQRALEDAGIEFIEGGVRLKAKG